MVKFTCLPSGEIVRIVDIFSSLNEPTRQKAPVRTGRERWIFQQFSKSTTDLDLKICAVWRSVNDQFARSPLAMAAASRFCPAMTGER
jgi:hypothetical protein